jgi:hypothetical protein
MKNHLITLTLLNIVIVLTSTGCGGGGEEGSAPTPTVEITPPIEEVAEEVSTEVSTDPSTDLTAETIATSELISEPGFDFISSADVIVTIPASPSTTTRYFINICTDFANVNEKVEINYESCKLRTTLTTLDQLFTLSLSNAELALVAQIWPIEEAALPVTIYWNITESGNRWRIAI